MATVSACDCGHTPHWRSCSFRKERDRAIMEKRRCLVCKSVTRSKSAAQAHPGSEDCQRVIRVRAEIAQRREDEAAEVAARKPFAFTIVLKAANVEVAEKVLREWLGGGDHRANVELIAQVTAYPVPLEN